MQDSAYTDLLNNKNESKTSFKSLKDIQKHYKLNLGKKNLNENYSIEERDSIELLSKETEPLQTEYIDELFIKSINKQENVIQIIDQM